MKNNQRNKTGNILGILIICFSVFILIGSVWLRRTYGEISLAMANEEFKNYLQNKRSLFFKNVIAPAVAMFVILLLLQKIRNKKKFNNKIFISASLLLMMLSLGIAELNLNVRTYLVRQFRLSKEQWYDVDRIVTHALGTVDGVSYTNSKEALEKSYQNGMRYLECDFSMTADNQIVACHDWGYWNRHRQDAGNSGKEEYVPTLEVFMNTQVQGNYTSLSGEDIILFMKAHPDVYIITDTKYTGRDTSEESAEAPFKALVELAIENDCQEVLDRFVIQIYHAYMYKDIVENIYPFSNCIFTLYQEGYQGDEDAMEEYAEFCMLHNIDVITMNAEYYCDALLDIANRYDLQIFVHTVNDKDEIQTFLEKGIGVYTDITDLKIL